ncbi:glycerophosphodiester phosphodiesterase [Oceanirhabdus sp. W0125-5]|uniref:glycerophosphodiester phosphodiesterase n=1 Tax=Oceanirhabdus sp. W0125-5 TaxID=2999116 RepID=UPI0022F310BC|nr:glycerophosphodiester phosphodiesterase [Oceanirhabdus sp. W0125-5]WBW94768.1 glycerophosphodiester phosphodiesterase [Oceanirhabdus sp. W0125-5]
MTKIFAHRGYSAKYPENTLLAFKKAIEYGVHGIETDVQMSKDGELILIHDEKVDRTSNGSGFIYNMTYDELLKLDFGEWKSRVFYGEKIPKLVELLDLVKGNNIELNLEIKNNLVSYPNIEEKILALISEFKIEDRVIISSFNHESVLKVKKMSKQVRCGPLLYSTLINPQLYIKEYNFDTYHPMYKSLNSEKIKVLKDNRIPICTYTVDNKDDIKYLIKKGVEVIITNEVEDALMCVKDKC